MIDDRQGRGASKIEDRTGTEEKEILRALRLCTMINSKLYLVVCILLFRLGLFLILLLLLTLVLVLLLLTTVCPIGPIS
jgi:hypothetical protein